VLGLEGGLDGGPPVPDKAATGPACGGCALAGLGGPMDGVGSGGALATDAGDPVFAGLPTGGGIMLLAGRDGGAEDLGGGGVAATGVAASAPAFPLTHRPSSLS
jgi:hypothetical protein